MSKNYCLYQNHIHQQKSMPTSSRLQYLNLKVDPPRTLRKLIHNKQEFFFVVCASKHMQQILLTVYDYQHTQQSKQIFLLCIPASIHCKKNCLIVVYASKHTQQILLTVYACQHTQQACIHSHLPFLPNMENELTTPPSIPSQFGK